MNDEQLAHIVSEMIESMGMALGIVAAAAAQQIDVSKFHSDLKAQIEAAKQFPSTPGFAVNLATHALAAVEAEKMLQKQAKR